MCKGCLALKVGEDEVTFHLKDGMKYSNAEDDSNISEMHLKFLNFLIRFMEIYVLLQVSMEIN